MMKVKVRFFARFRELLGTEIIAEVADRTTLPELIQQVAHKNTEGYDAIFDEHGHFREYVILMRNARRIDTADAARSIVADGDDIAVFPPVAGG
jgi:molybdopterin synthase sulfur carrier subunit